MPPKRAVGRASAATEQKQHNGDDSARENDLWESPPAPQPEREPEPDLQPEHQTQGNLEPRGGSPLKKWDSHTHCSALDDEEGVAVSSWASCSCYAAATAIVGVGVVAAAVLGRSGTRDGAVLWSDWVTTQTIEITRTLRRVIQRPEFINWVWLRQQTNDTVRMLSCAIQHPDSAATATTAGGLLAAGVVCQCAKRDEAPAPSTKQKLSVAQQRWKRAGRLAKSVRSFRGEVFNIDEFAGVYDTSTDVDLKEFEGLMSSKLIRASTGETSPAKHWRKLKNNMHQAVNNFQGAATVSQGASGLSPSKSIREAALVAHKVTKHSAIVFDCADDHTVVYRVQYEAESCSVRAKVIATCAGVNDILRRNAGSWFLKFSSQTCESQKKISEPDIVMVGTAAWYESGSDGIDKKRLQSVWNKIDGDQSGSLDKHELRRALEDMGKVMGDDEFASLWATIDDDQSGQVSFDEFMTWYEQQDTDVGWTGSANRAKDLVSSLTHKGLLCKRLGGAEQALFESLAVREAACRLGMKPHPQYFIGTGGTWVHCVSLTSTESPIILCNDGVLGWVDGVRRLDNSLDPLLELDAWYRDTVVAELDSVESHRVKPISKLQGSIVLSGAAFEAAVVANLHSERDELKPVRAHDAIQKMSAVLADLRQTMADHLLEFKTAASLSAKYREGQKVAMDLCNISLHIELLQRMVHADATLFFKSKWSTVSLPRPIKRSGLRRTSTRRRTERMARAPEEGVDAMSERASWVVGWYMHLLSTQFGIQFGGVAALMAHLDGLYAKAIKLANMYDEEHAGNSLVSESSKATHSESVALTLVTMRDVVESLRLKAKRREPTATTALLALSAATGGRMDGLDYKFKSVESLFRKLIQRLDRQLKANQHVPHCA